MKGNIFNQVTWLDQRVKEAIRTKNTVVHINDWAHCFSARLRGFQHYVELKLNCLLRLPD